VVRWTGELDEVFKAPVGLADGRHFAVEVPDGT
jgi:hypothetical protein